MCRPSCFHNAHQQLRTYIFIAGLYCTFKREKKEIEKILKDPGPKSHKNASDTLLMIMVAKKKL